MDSKTIDLLEALKDVTNQQQSTNSSLLGVVGRDLGNLPSKAATSLFGGLNALANAGAPKEEREAGAWKVPNLFDDPTVTGESSGSEKFAHIILGGVAPEIAALAVPYIGVSKLATGLGAGAKVASLLGDVGAGVVAGAPEGVGGMGKEAATFVGLNLGLGALGKAFKSLKGESKIANIVKETETPILPTEVIPPVPRDRRALRLPAQSADVSGPVIDIPARVSGPLDDPFANLQPEDFHADVLKDFSFEQELNRTPTQIHPELIPRPIMMDRVQLPAPKQEIIPVPQISNPKQLTLADLEIKQDPSKGKIPALPEYRRTEGGNVDLSIPLLLSGASGVAGGIAGGQLTGTDEGVAAGVAAGILAPWAIPLLMKHPFENSGLFKSAQERGVIGGPAFRLPNGYVIKGKVGQAHFDLVDQVPNSIPPSQIERGFVNDKGEFLTPHEANSEALLEGQINKRTFKENARTQTLGLTTEDLKKEGTYDTPFSSEGGSVGGGGKKKLKTLRDIQNHPNVKEAWDEGEDGVWIRLKDGYYNPLNDTTTIHGENLQQALQEFAEVKPKIEAGTSNLTATVEKNIADARMMQPNDPEGFLRKMADAAKAKGNQAATENFEAAIANLQSQKKIPQIESEIIDILNRGGTVWHSKGNKKIFVVDGNNVKEVSKSVIEKLENKDLIKSIEGNNIYDTYWELKKEIPKIDIIRQIEAVAKEQRGHAESVMIQTQRKIPAGVLTDAVEHVGDLIHRAGDFHGGKINYGLEGFIEKVNKFTRYLTSHPSRWPWEKEVDNSYRASAEYHYIEKNPEIRNAQDTIQERISKAEYKSPEWERALDDKRDFYNSLDRKAIGELEFQERQQAGQALKEYADAHRTLKPVSEWQRLGNEAAIAVGEQNWTKLRESIFQLKDEVDQYRALEKVGKEDEAFQLMTRPANQPFKLNTKNDAGSTSVSTLLPLAGAVAGGIAGYNEGQNEGAVAGAIGGLTLGILGGRMLDRLHVSTPSSTVPQVAKTVKITVKAGLDNALNTPVKDLGGQDVYGRGGILPKAFRAMENLFNLGLPSELHSIITRARGFASEIVDQATRGIKEAIGYNPPEDIQKLTNRFLNGELVEDQLPRGAYSAESYKKLVSTEREKLGLFTNAKGERFYATPEAKAEYLTTQEKAYLESVPEDWKDFANLQIGLRRNMNTFQQIIANALPEGPLKEKIEDSIGRYAPRLYRIFTDKKYAVTDDQIAVASKEFGLTKSQREIDTAINVHQAKEQTEFSKLVTELSQSNSLSNQERLARLSKFQPIQVGGKSYMAAPDIVESMKKYGNEDYLFNEVRSYLADLKGNREVYGVSKGIDSSLFMQRENLGPAWRDMLGEYTDPTERMAMGLQKMYAPAQAAKLIDMVGGMEIDGLPISLSGDKWAALNTQLKGIGDVANLQKLNAYKKLPEDIKFGEYKGLYVHRFLADYFSNDSRLWETALGQHMAEFNRFFKTTHVPFNPISQLRQIISMPIFALIGRANPASMMQAWSAKMGKNPELNAELIREGIWTADFIRGELHGGIEPIIEGRYDSEIVKGLKGAKEHILEAYRIPDMMVRGGTYIAAKNRIASKLGKALDDPEVIQQAVEWTDRYTMNYDNVSRAVRVARNIPFVNPFISFQAETLRILKNLAVDTARGDVERLAVLGGLIAVPELAMKAAEGSLKPDDRAQWDKMKSSLPPYMRDAFLLPIAKLQNGKFKYVSISPIIPQDNFQQAVKALGQNDMEAFWSINPFLSKDKSPLFNLISEAVTGESRQTGLKYRDTQEQLKSMVSEILPPIAPGGYEWNKLANVNVENLRSGKVEDWGDIALRYTTGLSSGVLKSDAVMRGAQSKLKQDIANLRSYYQRIAQSTSPEEIKKEAYEDYVEGVKLLIHDFSEKIQP